MPTAKRQAAEVMTLMRLAQQPPAAKARLPKPDGERRDEMAKDQRRRPTAEEQEESSRAVTTAAIKASRDDAETAACHKIPTGLRPPVRFRLDGMVLATLGQQRH